MDDGQVTAGLLALAVALGAGLLAMLTGLYHLFGGLAHFRTWRRAQEAKRAEQLSKTIEESVAPKVRQAKNEIESVMENRISEIRQQTAAAIKGHDGKLALLEADLARYFEQMIARDEKLEDSMREQFGELIRESENRLGKQIANSEKHLSKLIEAIVPPSRRRR